MSTVLCSILHHGQLLKYTEEFWACMHTLIELQAPVLMDVLFTLTAVHVIHEFSIHNNLTNLLNMLVKISSAVEIHVVVQELWYVHVELISENMNNLTGLSAIVMGIALIECK